MEARKILTLVLSLSLLFSMSCFYAFAGEVTAPNMTDTIVNVTADNAQDVLDGKYGDITGKTINFTENITTDLVLARPTKYQGSMTTYYQNNSLETPIP